MSEQAKEHRRRSRRKHPDFIARANAHQRALRWGVLDTLTLAEWREVLREYDYRCAYCFAPYEVMDHVVSMSDGGANAKENVVPACADCNARKEKGGGWVPSIASRFWPSLPERLYA